MVQVHVWQGHCTSPVEITDPAWVPLHDEHDAVKELCLVPVPALWAIDQVGSAKRLQSHVQCDGWRRPIFVGSDLTLLQSRQLERDIQWTGSLWGVKTFAFWDSRELLVHSTCMPVRLERELLHGLPDRWLWHAEPRHEIQRMQRKVAESAWLVVGKILAFVLLPWQASIRLFWLQYNVVAHDHDWDDGHKHSLSDRGRLS